MKEYRWSRNRLSQIAAWAKPEMRRIAILLTVLAVTTAAGCGLTELVSRDGAVWLSTNDIYFIRSVDSDSNEVWRHTGDTETLVARGSDIPNACGPVDFLFRAGQGRLGIALECSESERLVGFTPATRSFELLHDIASAGEVTLLPDGRAGYFSGGGNGCWNIAHFGDGSGISLGAASAAADCGGTGSAKSPHLLTNGDLAYLATDAAPSPNGDETRTWHLYISGANGGRELGPDLVGFPEMDVSPDDTTAVVALTPKDGGRLVLIDLTSGESRDLAKSSDYVTSPSISPDGSQVTFTEEFKNIKIAKLKS